MEEAKRMSSEEVNSRDGCVCDRAAKKGKEVVNGDDDDPLEDELSILTKFIDKLYQEAMEMKLSGGKEEETNSGVEVFDLNHRVPKKSRSRVASSRGVSRIGRFNSKFETGSCSRGEIEQEEEIVDRQVVENQRNADRLKKKRKVDICLEAGEMNKKKKKKKRVIIRENNDLDLNLPPPDLPPPDLPQEFRDEIERLNGTNIVLVAQKKVTSTDMDGHQSRFSLPRKTVRTFDFLSNEERKKFDSYQNISCSLIQPCLKVIQGLEFRKWKMNNTYSCILKKKWKEVSKNEENQLKENSSVVQVWSFRVDEELWFAMVNL